MEPYIEISSNNMSIHTAVCLLKKYLMDDPEIMFEFTDTALGFEEVLVFFVLYFGASLVVTDSRLRKRLRVAACCDHVNNHAITQAMNAVPVAGAPVFYVGCTLSPYFVPISEFINSNIMDFAGVCCPIQVANIPAHENMELLYTTQKRTRIFYFCNRNWLRAHSSPTRLYRLHLLPIHSSLSIAPLPSSSLSTGADTSCTCKTSSWARPQTESEAGKSTPCRFHTNRQDTAWWSGPRCPTRHRHPKHRRYPSAEAPFCDRSQSLGS